MAPSNKQVKIVVILCIIIYVVTLAVSLLNPALNYIPFLNGISACIVLLYWIIKQLRITKHYFELREVIVLGLEAVFFELSLYTIFAGSTSVWLNIIQYGIFGIHFLALLLFLTFMLTFRMKKLM